MPTNINTCKTNTHKYKYLYIYIYINISYVSFLDSSLDVLRVGFWQSWAQKNPPSVKKNPWNSASPFFEKQLLKLPLPSLKLTAKAPNMDGWNTTVSFSDGLFSGANWLLVFGKVKPNATRWTQETVLHKRETFAWRFQSTVDGWWNLPGKRVLPQPMMLVCLEKWKPICNVLIWISFFERIIFETWGTSSNSLTSSGLCSDKNFPY